MQIPSSRVNSPARKLYLPFSFIINVCLQCQVYYEILQKTSHFFVYNKKMYNFAMCTVHS